MYSAASRSVREPASLADARFLAMSERNVFVVDRRPAVLVLRRALRNRGTLPPLLRPDGVVLHGVTDFVELKFPALLLVSFTVLVRRGLQSPHRNNARPLRERRGHILRHFIPARTLHEDGFAVLPLGGLPVV